VVSTATVDPDTGEILQRTDPGQGISVPKDTGNKTSAPQIRSMLARLNPEKD